MNFTAKELERELKADGTNFNEPYDYFDINDFWWEAPVGKVLTTLQYGDFEVVAAAIGKKGSYSDGSWDNYIILKQGDRYFRLNGEYNSWDSEGWTSTEEVEPVKKTITVWESKHDY